MWIQSPFALKAPVSITLPLTNASSRRRSPSSVAAILATPFSSPLPLSGDLDTGKAGISCCSFLSGRPRVSDCIGDAGARPIERAAHQLELRDQPIVSFQELITFLAIFRVVTIDWQYGADGGIADRCTGPSMIRVSVGGTIMRCRSGTVAG